MMVARDVPLHASVGGEETEAPIGSPRNPHPDEPTNDTQHPVRVGW